MSFAAEPYGTFVEDLLANLTGGVSRVRFTYLDDELPFRLADHERVRAASVRVHGISEGAFSEFVGGRDFQLAQDGTLVWAGADGFNPPGALLPDAGTDVWVGFDRLPGGPPPALNDRNPGSVLRTLAESFAGSSRCSHNSSTSSTRLPSSTRRPAGTSTRSRLSSGWNGAAPRTPWVRWSSAARPRHRPRSPSPPAPWCRRPRPPT